MSQTDNHRQHLASYMTKQHIKPQKSASKQKTKKISDTVTKTMMNQILSQKPVQRGKVTFHDIPDEILLHIFSHLSPQDLMVAAQVNKAWHTLANDNCLWKPIYKKYSTSVKKCKAQNGEVKSLDEEVKSNTIQALKRECMERCVLQRNKKVNKLMRRISPYTGLPESKEVQNALLAAGVSWQVALVDASGHEHCMDQRDVFYHTMAVNVRWFSLEIFPIHEVREIHVYSHNPVFFNPTSGNVVKDGPYQRSLILSQEFDWKSWTNKNKPVGGDDLISLYCLPEGLTVATWKNDGEIAFLTLGLSLENLVKRCLHGNSSEMFTPPELPVFDAGMSSQHGLIDYKVTVQLRTMRKALWDQQFRNVDCRELEAESEYAEFVLIRPGEKIIMSEDFVFPWKTDAFKGKVQNITMLDWTVLDEENKVLWTGSTVASIQKNENKAKVFDFDYRYDSVSHIEHSDNIGKISLHVCKMDTGESFITSLILHLSLEVIDKRFGTLYMKKPKSAK